MNKTIFDRLIDCVDYDERNGNKRHVISATKDRDNNVHIEMSDSCVLDKSVVYKVWYAIEEDFMKEWESDMGLWYDLNDFH